MEQWSTQLAQNVLHIDFREPIPVHKEVMVAVIPAYNEERFIGSVVLKAREYVDHVIVVDDGSADCTAEIARMAGAIVVQHEVNSGKAVAMNTAFQKALEFNPAVVIAMDGDWQHMPEELPKVAEPILKGEADLVVGSRYLENTSEVPLKRIIGHWGLTSAINMLSGISLTDSQSGFRAFSREAMEKISFSSQGFTVESEMQFLASDHKLKVCEVPITIRYLDAPKRSVISQGLQVLNGILNLVGQHRPLLYFGGVGLLTLILSAVMVVLSINTYNTTSTLPLATSIIAVALGVFGTMAMFTGLILHTLRSVVIQHIKR
ncbi:MAG: glycosyltransferase family 2 protein [Chloroflexota bacterium]